MTQAEKLEALVRKAIENGWTPGAPGWAIRGNGIYYIGDVTIIREDFATLIFNHGFARALFGDEMVAKKYPMCEHSKAAFNYHLQNAVISNDPIDYFYRAVFGDE